MSTKKIHFQERSNKRSFILRIIRNVPAQQRIQFFWLLLLDYPTYLLHKILVLSQNPWSLPILKITGSLDSAIRTMLSIPIRNSVILIARQEYLKNTTGSRYNKSEYGIIYAELRRIEYIVSGIQRDIATCIKAFPLLILYIREIYKHSFQILGIFMIVNVIALLPARLWIQLRMKAYKADNDLSSQIYAAFNNFGRKLPQTGLFKELDNENKLYVLALNMKYKYKITLILLNSVLICGCYLLYGLSVQFFVTFVFFMLNYIKILIAVISILSLLEGLPSMTVETRPQIQSNQAIEIVNLQIPGVFVNLTLRIQPGEKVVLTGDNGSGKTLVLRLVGGYESYYQNPYIVPTLLEETNTPLLDDFLLLQNNLIWQSEFQEFHYLLNQSSLTRGQQLFLVIAATILSNKNTHILIDEALDPITGTLLAGIGQMIRWSKATILVTSHNKNVIKMFNRKLTIVDQEIKE